MILLTLFFIAVNVYILLKVLIIIMAPLEFNFSLMAFIFSLSNREREVDWKLKAN